jgi:hypothetical protein
MAEAAGVIKILIPGPHFFFNFASKISFIKYSSFPGCDAAHTGKQLQTFRRTLLPPYSGYSKACLEYWGRKLLRNVDDYSTSYTASYPRRLAPSPRPPSARLVLRLPNKVFRHPSCRCWMETNRDSSYCCHCTTVTAPRRSREPSMNADASGFGSQRSFNNFQG